VELAYAFGEVEANGRVLAPVNGFSPRYREAALSEARRVARKLIIASEPA